VYCKLNSFALPDFDNLFAVIPIDDNFQSVPLSVLHS
jgi:hypothetical protein